MTTPTPRRPPSAKLRTTRPRQSTFTSAADPNTSAGSEIVKSTDVPTGTSASMRKRTPLAEMFSVSTIFSGNSAPDIPDWLAAGFNATGSLMGKRGAPCTSVYPLRFPLTAASIPLAASDTFAATFPSSLCGAPLGLSECTFQAEITPPHSSSKVTEVMEQRRRSAGGTAT